jgi:hypothetical protein
MLLILAVIGVFLFIKFGMGGTEGPEDVTNGDEDGNSIVDQTMAAALAISETGSRLN